MLHRLMNQSTEDELYLQSGIHEQTQGGRGNRLRSSPRRKGILSACGAWLVRRWPWSAGRYEVPIRPAGGGHLLVSEADPPLSPRRRPSRIRSPWTVVVDWANGRAPYAPSASPVGTGSENHSGRTEPLRPADFGSPQSRRKSKNVTVTTRGPSRGGGSVSVCVHAGIRNRWVPIETAGSGTFRFPESNVVGSPLRSLSPGSFRSTPTRRSRASS